MKALLFWLAFMAAVITGSWIAVVRSAQASSALRSFVRPGPLSPGHAYLANQCEACHVTNTGVTAAKCTGCHANDERLLGRQPTAFHASVSECGTCHTEHQGANRNIRTTAMDHVELAKIGVRALARAAPADGASAATLKSMETWLRIRIPGQLGESSAGEVLNCAGCHLTKDRHLGLFGKDCAQCHVATSWRVAEFVHPSPRSFNCAQCHQAPPSHYMMHFNMISKTVAGQEDAKVSACCGPAQVYQCYRCHQTTSWNDIRGLGYYKHH